MAVLFTKEIISAIMNEMQNASESVQIITAYCKESSLKYLADHISKCVVDKKLMVRFRLDDLVKGSTDFSILDYCMQTGWKVYIRFDLHAKTYIVDNKRGYVGSANATNSGLGIGKAGNIEMGALVDIEPQDIAKINALFRDAIFVDNLILEKLRIQYSSVDASDMSCPKTWNRDITSLFRPRIESLFSYELPESSDIVKGMHIGFLDEQFNGDWQSLKEIFRWSNAYIWLLNTLMENGGVMFFGKLSSKLHDALVTDPKPYRKDVKILLANLLAIIEQLKMEEMIIDRPNYSQRIQLVK